MTENQRYWIVLMASLVVAYLGGLDSIPDGTYSPTSTRFVLTTNWARVTCS